MNPYSTQRVKLCMWLCSTLLFSVFTIQLSFAQADTVRSTAHFDFDDCNSNTFTKTNEDYSEFTANLENNQECASLAIVGDHLYRSNPTTNVHSCTPGVEGSPGMCFGQVKACDFDTSGNTAIKIDVQVTPGPSGTGSLSGINFYEQSIPEFIWIGGLSGVNDYPTLYGINVRKNGNVIFRQDSIPTSQNWTLESFDFSSNTEFSVTTATVFNIELSSYCTIGNGATMSVWDLDEISVYSECIIGGVSGGTLEGGPFEFCVGNGEDDNIPPGSITLSGNDGSNNAWIVTDDQGNILGLPPMPSAVNFDGAGAGTCLIWNISYNGTLTGLAMGMNANDIQGDFGLSNPISVVRNQPEGGVLEGGPFEFCVGDGLDDNLAPGSITLAGNSGSNSQWVVTDDQGNILGLPPMPSAVNFDGAGAGTCLIWHLSYEDGLIGAEMGMNANELEGCYSLSNPISVVRNQPEGGVLEGGPFEFCVGDGLDDNLAPGSISLTGNSGSNSQWVVTDDQGNILGLPPMPSAVNFDGAGAGTCLVWHLSYEDGLIGAEMGMNANELEGCYSLSNPISVVRNQPEGGVLEGGPFEFCVGDGLDDNLAPGSITLAGNSGSNSQWVVTDDQGNILGLPPMPSAVNFDGAGAGTCLIWHLSYEDGLIGAEMGMNANELEGCFSLSNPISVVRNQPEGGVLEGGPFEFCVGDGINDLIPADSITLTGNSGSNSQWVVTDDQGNILGLPPSPYDVNFDGAGTGTCLIWHLSYEDGITGAEMGMNANDIQGCFNLSNSIAVVRTQPEGGSLSGGPFSFCVGDGIRDTITPGSITLMGNSGPNNAWIVTDLNGNILGLPPMPSVVDFDGAGVDTCLIWHISYEDGLTGLMMGNNALLDLQGCFNISNNISVIREACTGANQGGNLSGGPFEFCVGDGVRDTIALGDISLMGNSGMNSQWVVTDDQGNILGLPPMPSVVDFDGAGAGTCLIWHLSYSDGLSGLMMGTNINTGLTGDYDFSNSIAVVRTQAEGGTLSGGPFTFCVGDGIRDTITPGSITLMGNSGPNNAWIVTDLSGNILGLPPMPSVVDFDGAGVDTCLIWHISYENGLTGLMMGNNALSDLQGCYNISNSISVIREDCGSANQGGNLSGGPFEFCVGDGISDNLQQGDITLSGNAGMNSQWVVTDDLGNILGLPPMPSAVDFDGAGAGTCLIWHLSYSTGLTGLTMGNNVNSDLMGDYDFSNSVAVNRSQPEGGMLSVLGGPYEFCVGDGIADQFQVGDVSVTGMSGAQSQWVVTDDQGNILGLPNLPSDVDFDGAGAGTCLVWHLSFETGLSGLSMGNNIDFDLNGCYDFSDSLEVVRNQPDGGAISGGTYEFCVGDGTPDNIPVGDISLSGNTGPMNQWVVTDDQGNILGLPNLPSDVDFDGAGLGTCLIWHLSFEPGLQGLAMGNNANSDLVGCFDLSNNISVTRNDCSGGTGGIVINEVTFNGDVEIKNTGSTTVDISSYWLCEFPDYAMIGNLNLICGGDLTLDPDEIVVVNSGAGFSTSSADGEMAIYTSNSFGSSTAMIDYVEWGSSGHQRASVAIGAGIWSAGDFVPSPGGNDVLLYDGDGDASSDWSAGASTPCTNNLTTGNGGISSRTLTLFPNPSSSYVNVAMNAQTQMLYDVEVYDMYGTMVSKTKSMSFETTQRVDVSTLRAGHYMIVVHNNVAYRTGSFVVVK